MKENRVPSLCDSCFHAYILEGGFASMSGIGKEEGYSCKQRYCNKKKIAIHFSGFESCDMYKKL